MQAEILSRLTEYEKKQWLSLLNETDLHPDTEPQRIVLVWDGDTLAATGAREGYLLKYIAVRDAYQGADVTATVISALRRDAFENGHRHLLLYTKPQNELIFSSLLFYPIARTRDVLLMEDAKNGIDTFLSVIPPATHANKVGSIVMNCDPFTLGHRHLIETAAKQCDHVYVFVLSEDKGRFSAEDRLAMVKKGTADLPNVTVHPSGHYLISSATFPTYFLKNRDSATEVHCALDMEVFLNHFVPHCGITHRFVGDEPLSPMTKRYNEALKSHLPTKGITVCEIPRFTMDNQPVNASAVRRYLDEDNRAAVQTLVPKTTYEFIFGR